MLSRNMCVHVCRFSSFVCTLCALLWTMDAHVGAFHSLCLAHFVLLWKGGDYGVNKGSERARGLRGMGLSEGRAHDVGSSLFNRPSLSPALCTSLISLPLSLMSSVLRGSIKTV